MRKGMKTPFPVKSLSVHSIDYNRKYFDNVNKSCQNHTMKILHFLIKFCPP